MQVGEPHWLRVEKAEPLFSSQARGRGCLRAFEQWREQGTGRGAQPPSNWEPALGMKPYPDAGSCSSFFFLNKVESE